MISKIIHSLININARQTIVQDEALKPSDFKIMIKFLVFALKEILMVEQHVKSKAL